MILKIKNISGSTINQKTQTKVSARQSVSEASVEKGNLENNAWDFFVYMYLHILHMYTWSCTYIVVTFVQVVRDMLRLLRQRCHSHIPDSRSLMISPKIQRIIFIILYERYNSCKKYQLERLYCWMSNGWMCVLWNFSKGLFKKKNIFSQTPSPIL